MSTVIDTQQTQQDDALPRGDILYEMVDGKLVEKNVSAYAAWIALLLSRRLADFCEQNRVGTVTTELVYILNAARKLRRRPDVAFVSPEKWPVGQPPPPAGDWELIPDIAIEITSPNDSVSKVTGKVNEYLHCGVTEVWVIIPEGQFVQIHRSPNDITTYGPGQDVKSELLPGWSMPVAELLPHELKAELDEL